MPEVMQGAGQGLVKTNQPGDCTFLGLGLRAAGGWRKGWRWSCAGRRHGPSRPWPCAQVHSWGSVSARSLGDPVCPAGGAVLG